MYQPRMALLLELNGNLLITIAAFILLIYGIYFLTKPTAGESSLEIHFFVGSFKIKTPNVGLILCLLAFILFLLMFWMK